MKKYFILIVMALVFFLPSNAQDSFKGYKFTDKVVLKNTNVKSQDRTGTCWSYATTSYIESELMRMGNPEFDLSEMYFVRNAYITKADLFVRFHGEANFSQGGQAHDVLMHMDEKGFVTEAAYNGKNYGSETHAHSEMESVLRGVVDAVVKNRNRKLSTAWKTAFNAILDAYLGEVPEKINVGSKSLSPVEFAKSTGFNANNYVEITSYSHHPFYGSFILEIPDNWTHDKYYNVPMNELMAIMDNAIDKGYTVCWDGDVGEKGFSHNNNVAIVPQMAIDELADSEKLKWSKLTDAERQKQMYSFEAPVPEVNVTQEMRQVTFDSYQTTDDHLMHMVGKAKDQNGTRYFLIKNSWGESNDLNGYLYMSDAYTRLKTIAILVHKDAIPKEIKSKLNL